MRGAPFLFGSLTFDATQSGTDFSTPAPVLQTAPYVIEPLPELRLPGQTPPYPGQDGADRTVAADGKAVGHILQGLQ